MIISRNMEEAGNVEKDEILIYSFGVKMWRKKTTLERPRRRREDKY